MRLLVVEHNVLARLALIDTLTNQPPAPKHGVCFSVREDTKIQTYKG